MKLPGWTRKNPRMVRPSGSSLSTCLVCSAIQLISSWCGVLCSPSSSSGVSARELTSYGQLRPATAAAMLRPILDSVKISVSCVTRPSHRNSALWTHMGWVNIGDKHQCIQCKQSFCQFFNLDRHIKAHRATQVLRPTR